MRIEIQRLLLTKQFLDSAQEALARTDSVSLLKGVLLGDLAGETLLKATLDALGKRVDEKSNFLKLIDQVVAGGIEVHKDFSCARRLRPLREIRNPAQHSGIIPGRDEALRRFSEAKAALKHLCTVAFGQDLGRLRPTDFVKTPDVAKFLVEAERAFAAGDYTAGMRGCVVAFECVIRQWTKFNQSLFGLEEGPDDLFGQIVATLSSGIYLPDLKRFRKVTLGFAGQAAADGTNLRVDTTGNPSPEMSDTERHEASEFALDFVAGAALQIEAVLADG